MGQIRFISVNDAYDSSKEGSNGTEIHTRFKSWLYDFHLKNNLRELKIRFRRFWDIGKTISK